MQGADFHIRPFENDYLALAALFNELYPNWPSSPEQLKVADDSFPKEVFSKRWVAEVSGEVVAALGARQDSHFPHPRQLHFNIWVREHRQGIGIGSGLFRQMEKELESRPLDWIMCAIPERFEKGARFLSNRGFTESHRHFQSKADLCAFHPGKYAAAEERLNERGIRILNLKEVTKPGHREEIFALQLQLDRDVPGAELRAERTFDSFWKKIEEEQAAGDIVLLAAADEKFVGIHFAGIVTGNEWFHVKITGVLPEYKHMGIATVLKAKGMAHGKERGFAVASTWNDTRNGPILALNEKFGFKREPATISFIKRF